MLANDPHLSPPSLQNIVLPTPHDLPPQVPKGIKSHLFQGKRQTPSVLFPQSLGQKSGREHPSQHFIFLFGYMVLAIPVNITE